MIYNTIHWKLNIEQHEPHLKLGINSCAPEVTQLLAAWTREHCVITVHPGIKKIWKIVMKIKFQCLMSIALVNRNSEVNINIMASVLLEAGTACPSRMPGFTPGWVFLRGGFVVGCFFLFFFCLRSVTCVPNIASFSGLSILYCTFGFL